MGRSDVSAGHKRSCHFGNYTNILATNRRLEGVSGGARGASGRPVKASDNTQRNGSNYGARCRGGEASGSGCREGRVAGVGVAIIRAGRRQ